MITPTRRGLVPTTELLHQHSNLRGWSAGLPRWIAGRAGCLRMMRGPLMNTTSPGSGRRTTSLKLQQVDKHSQFSPFRCAFSEINVPISFCAATVQFEGAERERSRAQTEQTRLAKTSTTLASTDSTTLRLIGDTPPLLGERVDPSVPLERQV